MFDKEIKELNKNLEKIIEVGRDFNIVFGSLIGYKVTYDKKKERIKNE